MAIAYLLLNLTVILLAVGLRYSPDALRFAAPAPLADVWWAAAAAAAGATVALAALHARQLRRRRTRRALAWLAILPLMLAYEWLILPPLRLRPVDWVALGLLMLPAMVCILVRGRYDQQGLTRRNFVAALKLLAAPTLAAVVVIAAVGLSLGVRPEGRRVAAALLYPVWAWAQLLLLQVFLVPNLRALGDRDGSVMVAAAGLIALAHWPNGLLMAGTFLGGLLWTWVYLRRPNVYALALSMGLLAAAAISFLPRERWLNNLRTGPIFVERKLEDLRNGSDRSRSRRGATCGSRTASR
jgi:hypothetical protein